VGAGEAVGVVADIDPSVGKVLNPETSHTGPDTDLLLQCRRLPIPPYPPGLPSAVPIHLPKSTLLEISNLPASEMLSLLLRKKVDLAVGHRVRPVARNVGQMTKNNDGKESNTRT